MSRAPRTPGQPLSALVVTVRMNERHRAVVEELASTNGIDNAEVLRRIMDAFIQQNFANLAPILGPQKISA